LANKSSLAGQFLRFESEENSNIGNMLGDVHNRMITSFIIYDVD
jgi:hypothetical protein